MDSGKIATITHLCNEIDNVSTQKGFKADFSGVSEGKGCDFKMVVSFSKRTEEPAPEPDLFTPNPPEQAQ